MATKLSRPLRLHRRLTTVGLLCSAALAPGIVHAAPALQVGPPASPDASPPLQQQPATPANAPEQAPAASTDAGAAATSENGVADVIVTALRREQSLQTVPVSAAAFSARGLTEKAVTRLSDLQFAAPSLSITESGGLVQAANIRGIGLASGSPSVANGVATYVDGLFQPPIVQTGSFYDIAGVEVLRGPQGTLVGSNSTGGAIFINSQNPKLDGVGGYAQAGYGNYDTVTAQGAINLPLGDTLAVRAAGNYRRHDSYYRDVGSFGNDAGKLDERSARFGLLWRPGDFQALVKSEILDYDTGGFAYRPIAGTQFGPGRVGDIRTLSYNSPSRGKQHAWVNSAEFRYNFANDIALRTILGWQDKDVSLLLDNDGSQLARIGTDQYVRERQFTTEVNVISPATWRFNWIFGGYYQRNRINVALNQTDPAGVGLNVAQEQVKYTTGLFAQLNYKLVDKLEVQLGGRYSRFKAEGTGAVRIGLGVPGFPAGGLQVADLAAGNSDGRVTGKLALNYQADQNNLIYAFAARGYKPGGYNSAVSTFRPETVWNYEAGWKSTLADGHVRTQVDAFYNDYNGFQFGIIDTTTGQNGVTNLPSATIKGLEAQVQVKFGGFSADASGSYVDSKLPAFRAVNPRLLPPGNLGPQCAPGVPSNPPACFNYGPFTGTAGGDVNLFSPKWTYNLGAQYSIPAGGEATLTPRINYAYVGGQFANLFYSPTLDLLRARGLLSALVTFQSGRWQVEAYGNNLTNKDYVSGQSGNNEFYGAPREYGARVSLDF